MEVSAFEVEHDDGFAPPRLSHRLSTSLRPFSSLLPLDSFTRKNTAYGMLPPEPMRLTVIKLDGSSFDVEVLKTANVAEFKEAVESAFSHLPKQGAEMISWRHVWGHFCLCYAGQHLIIETDYLMNYGIKDRDKLQIVRHITPNYDMEKQRSARRAGSSSSDDEGEIISEEGEEDCDNAVKAAQSTSSEYHSYSILPTEEDVEKHKSRQHAFSRRIRVFCSSFRRIMTGGFNERNNLQRRHTL